MIRFPPLWLVAFGARRSCRSVAGIAIAGLVGGLPSLAIAVGLGQVTQQSGLGQSLRMVVPVTLGEGEDVPAECFRIAPGQGAADGIPDLLFGRVIVERTASGTALVVTTPRPVHDPVVRITIQAGCETSVRREYTLFMDPPAIEAPVVTAAQQPSPREVLGLAPPGPAAREARRPPRSQPRSAPATRSAQAPVSGAQPEAPAKGAAPKGSAATRQASRPPPAPTAAARPRLSVSSGSPGALPGALATEADRERARQERANAIEAETQVLRQRIVELTAMVEKMQQELRAQELAEQAAATQAAKAASEAAKTPEAGAKAPDAAVASGAAAEAGKAPAQDTAPAVEAGKPTAAGAASAPTADAAKAAKGPGKAEPPPPVPSWWEQNALLIAAIIGLPLVIAAGLLWKRRRDGTEDDQWRTAAIPLSRSSSQLRHASAGLVMPGHTVSPAMSREMASPVAPRDAVDALAVTELSHVTEEARVFTALGHNDRAIEVLQDHIRRLPRSMPAAWLMLLDLYHQEGNRSEFRKLADTFHTHFNVRAPLWEEFTGESSLTDGIENFPGIERQVAALWRKPDCRPYLEGLLYDNREGRRNGFPLATYSDILLLLQVLDAPPEVDIDEDLVAAGKLEGRPKAKAAAATAAKKAMPPDPAARPAQQPIRFEIEPPESSERKRN